MDFVDWCTVVLTSLIDARNESPSVRTFGISQQELATRLYGDGVVDPIGFFDSSHASPPLKALLSAIYGLRDVGLVEQTGVQGSRWKITDRARELGKDPVPVWQKVCARQLERDCEELLRAVNRLSPVEEADYTWLDSIDGDRVLAELGWTEPSRLWAAAGDLKELGLAGVGANYIARELQVAASYQGLVWESRRALTIQSQCIDRLVAEWETTSIEFKREVNTKTKDEKAEFIKDVLGLANTQASGRRWLIIGFDDKTRSYVIPPAERLTQDHVERLIANYVQPTLQVRYEVVDYRLGQIGKLEVLREPAKLPYKVSKSEGDKKRITEGQVFVRHGSQTEPPTDAERRAIDAEGEQARKSGQWRQNIPLESV